MGLHRPQILCREDVGADCRQEVSCRANQKPAGIPATAGRRHAEPAKGHRRSDEAIGQSKRILQLTAIYATAPGANLRAVAFAASVMSAAGGGTEAGH